MAGWMLCGNGWSLIWTLSWLPRTGASDLDETDDSGAKTRSFALARSEHPCTIPIWFQTTLFFATKRTIQEQKRGRLLWFEANILALYPYGFERPCFSQRNGRFRSKNAVVCSLSNKAEREHSKQLSMSCVNLFCEARPVLWMAASHSAPLTLRGVPGADCHCTLLISAPPSNTSPEHPSGR